MCLKAGNVLLALRSTGDWWEGRWFGLLSHCDRPAYSHCQCLIHLLLGLLECRILYLDLLEDTKESRVNGRSYCLGDCFHCRWLYQRDMACFGWLMLRGYFYCTFSFEVVVVEAGLGMSCDLVTILESIFSLSISVECWTG